jgi:hypothetical protein
MAGFNLKFLRRGKLDTISPSLVFWLLILLVAAGLVAGMAYHKQYRDELSPKADKWQAVFLSNGQVYFGHLSYERRMYILRDIYYLQAPQDLQSLPTTPTASLNLVKLGEELHGPEDAMYIDRDKVMFWENLKDSSRVVEAIGRLKQ